ncbi:hypothetical protein BIFLAC_00349 [Bifidobacterium animalis subsp. lactis HN019]|nr:hypothetical protein BIFLAC_00349 [Bifidobacterium animalis subsp. lactis HN019]
MSFWLRRCSEQSRVPTASTVPNWSPSTCTSTCHSRARKRSTKQSPLPNATSASCIADSKAAATSSGSCTTFRPRPPPP